MNAQIGDWDDLRYFLAVARSGSLSAAARVLGVNHSTVFRRIAGLEDNVGTRLFERLPKGYALTAVGEEMFAVTQRIEDDVLALDRQVLGMDQDMRGTVRFTTVEEILRVVAPHLQRFLDDHPGITVSVDTDQRVLSLARREADVAIRPGGRPKEADVVGRKLCDMASATYASVAYLERHGTPKRPRDLDGHNIITFDTDRDHSLMSKWFVEQAPDARVALRSSSMLGQLQAARAGIGVALLPTFMGDVEPDLVRLHDMRFERETALWLLLHADLRQTARVRAFVDFVSDALAGDYPLFRGELGSARAGTRAPKRRRTRPRKR